MPGNDTMFFINGINVAEQQISIDSENQTYHVTDKCHYLRHCQPVG